MRSMLTGVSVLGIAAVLAVCGQARGQNQAQPMGDGHALDAGLHATQGRINPRASGIEDQIRFNNAVINGSAPGGMSFRGSTGYRAPDQFGARVGSDSQYGFRRDSFVSGLAASGAGVRGSDALRYQFALTTGQHVPGFLATAPQGLAREGTVSTTANASVTSLRSTSDFVTGQASRPSLVGVRQDEFGAEYVARASPLLGVTWVKTAESPLGVGAAKPAPPAPGTVAPGTTPQPGTAQPATGKTDSPRASFSGLESTVRGVQGALDRESALDTRVRGENLSVRNEMQTRIANRFRDGFNEKPETAPDAKAAPEPQTLDVQLERLHNRLRGVPESEGIAKKPTRAPDGTMIPPPLPKKDKPATGEGADENGKDGKKPDDKNTDDGRKKEKPRADGLPTSTPITPELLRGMRKAGSAKVDHLIAPAPAVGADTPDPDGYQAMMREGEEMLSKGQFFGAEERFVRAIAAASGDPMARAGRVHAEIGAGLYLSAATNLRSLIADHPELVSTRYADRLLPSADRAKIISEQLLEEEKRSESLLGRESALVLAYLGYQRGDNALITKGLEDLSKRIPAGQAGDADRALLEVLRAAWSK